MLLYIMYNLRKRLKLKTCKHSVPILCLFDLLLDNKINTKHVYLEQIHKI